MALLDDYPRFPITPKVYVGCIVVSVTLAALVCKFVFKFEYPYSVIIGLNSGLTLTYLLAFAVSLRHTKQMRAYTLRERAAAKKNRESFAKRP